MKKALVLLLAVAVGAPLAALGVTGGKKEFDHSGEQGRVQVFSKFRGAFRYMVEDGLLRAWTDDGATRRSQFSFLLAPRADRTLVVGPGAGAVVEAALFHGAQSVRVVMKNPLAVKALPYVDKLYADAMANPKTKITYTGPAAWTRKPDGEYDMIFLWPAVFRPEETAGTLDTQTLRRMKDLLSEEGVLTLWIPLGLYSTDQVKAVMAAFVKEFPSAAAWAPELSPELEWLALTGSRAPVKYDLERIGKSLERVSKSYRMMEGVNAFSFLSAYIAGGEKIMKALGDDAGGAKPFPEAKTPDWKTGGANASANYKFLVGLREPVTGRTSARGEQARKLNDYFTARTKMIEGRMTRRTTEGGREIGLYEEAEKLAPDDPSLAVLYQTLGKDYFMGNTPQKAAYLLEKAKKINPNHAATRFYLGKVYEEMRRYEKASAEYRKLKELEPTFMESIVDMNTDY